MCRGVAELLAFAVGRLNRTVFGLKLLQRRRGEVLATEEGLHRGVRPDDDGAVIPGFDDDVLSSEVAG
jgi:hypothetical protein